MNRFICFFVLLSIGAWIQINGGEAAPFSESYVLAAKERKQHKKPSQGDTYRVSSRPRKPSK